MLPSKLRLPYREFSASGYQRRAFSCFSVGIKKNSLAINRFGIVIGKAAIKNAVYRNFWRRQAREAFFSINQQWQTDKTKQGYDVFLVFRHCATLPLKNIFKKEFADALLSLTSYL